MDIEEYDYKLSKNDPILTAKVISRILEVIRQKCVENLKINCLEIAEFKYLKQKCLSADPVLCCCAAKGLVYITKWRLVELPKMMSEATAMIPFTENHRGLLIVLIELLMMDLDTKLHYGEYKCPFNLNVPQHPLISILAHNADNWGSMLNHIKKLHQVCEQKFQEPLNELFRPVYLYILCEPYMKIPVLCKMQFLKFLLEDNQFGVSLIPDIIGWLQISSAENQTYTCNVLLEIFNSRNVKSDKDLREFVLFWLLSLLHELHLNKSDPSEILLTLSSLNNLSDCNCSNIILLLLAKCFAVVQPIYLRDLIQICLQILPNENVNIIILSALKSSLINWMLYPSIILEDCTSLLHKLFLKIDSINSHETLEFRENVYFSSFLNTNQHLYLIFELCSMFEAKSSLHKNIVDFLNSSNKFSGFLLKHTIQIISGIFIFDAQDDEITLSALSLLLKYAASYSNSSNNILTLLVFRLANCNHSIVQYRVLKGIVRLGKGKENLHIILSTIKALGDTSPQMKTMSLTLYYELWKYEPKCYALLQKLLAEENKLDRLHFSIVKANVIKELCELRPELYGSELATYISKVLNSCKMDNGVATSLALEGLTHLCTKGIIDITTAWDTLEPSFKSETRTNVIVSFCNLLAELPNVYMESPKYDKMTIDVIGKLWDYILNNATDARVVEAAYNALSCFSIEQISQHFVDEHEPGQSNKEPWFMMILQNNIYTYVEPTVGFLIKCVSKEICEFGRGIYYVLESKAEPSNYDYLPAKCILRGLMSHIKSNYKTQSAIEIACFKILSQEYPKPLPPLDWCFLQEFVHDEKFRKYCITVATHQVILSGTARRFIVNLMVAITENFNFKANDLLCILSNLKHICNSIQPVIMKPFFKSALNCSLNLAQESNDYSLFDEIINSFKALMLKDDFQEANKSILSDELVETSDEMRLTNKSYNKLNECLALLPFKYIKPLITPKLWPQITSEKLKKGIILCSQLARNANDSPFTYFNEIISAIGSAQTEKEYFLRIICDVTEELKHHDSLPHWLLELLGQTQLELIDSNCFSSQVSFMCDILVMFILSTSGYKVFLKLGGDLDGNHVEHLFPQALVFLLKEEKWNKYTTQVLEWLYYMVNYKTTPVNYKTTFYRSLIALRHEPEFKGSLKWLKYIGCRITKSNDC